MDWAEHRRSQGELRKAVTWLGPAVDHAADALFVLDDGGTIVDVNRQACESLGYAPGELIGRTPVFFDSGLGSDLDFQRRNQERLDVGEIVSFETTHRRRDATSFPVEVRIRRFWDGDRPYALESVRDITEQKRAEDEQRAHLWFLESMDGINRAVQGTGDLEAVASAVLGELIGIFACERARLLHPCDPESAGWRVVVQRTAQGSGGSPAAPDDRPIDAAAFAAARDADGPVLYGPGAGPANHSAHRLQAQMAIALRPKLGDPYLLVLDLSSGARAWTTEERRLFQEIGRRFADALANLALIERRASEARFRTFVDHAADGFFVLDARLTIVDVNRKACESLGYGRSELIGMHPRDIDAGLDEPSIGRLVDRADAGETLTFETLHRRKDGSAFPVEIRTHRIAQAGEPYYLCLVRDISERRRAEEAVRATEARFRTLVDSAADAFMLHAPEGRVIDVNQQACESLGYTRDELIGMMPAQFDADLDPEVLKQIVARVGTGEPFTFETRHRRKDGTLFPVEVRARQIWQADRWYGISMSRDITERKRAEQERERLRRLETELAGVNRVTAMGELAASIAHEVNQPLGAMVANAAACERWLTARPPATEKARRVLQAISADGQRAGEVIGRIRALMKRQQPRMAAIDVNEAIRDVIALAQQEMSRNAIVLATRAAQSLPAVQADRVQLQQVLLNLVINAIEAMSAIEGRARELTIASSADDTRVVVEVRDSGPGLEPQRAEQLFEAFYTTKPQGLGIGLSISRSIVEAHGGRLWAESNAPHGAVFAFSLPVGT